MATSKKIQSGEEKSKAPSLPNPAAPLEDDAMLPEGTAHGHSPAVAWPAADDGSKKPFKNLK